MQGMVRGGQSPAGWSAESRGRSGDKAQEVAATRAGTQQDTEESLAWTTGAIQALIPVPSQPSCMTLGKSLTLS